MNEWRLPNVKLPEITLHKFHGIAVYCSEAVLCKDADGTAIVCRFYADGHFCDEYGEPRTIAKWMEIPE